MSEQLKAPLQHGVSREQFVQAAADEFKKTGAKGLHRARHTAADPQSPGRCCA